MFDVLCIGSATLDAFVNTGNGMFRPCKDNPTHVKVPFGSKILIKDLQFFSGGGGTNTAVGFSRLGFRAGWIGKIGDDETGRVILSELKKEKVNISHSSIEKRGKSGYSIILDSQGHDRTVLAYKGCNDNLLLQEVHPASLKTRWLYCSSQLRQSAKTLMHITNLMKNRGAKVAFNPSTYMISSEQSIVNSMLKVSDVLIFNAEEAAFLAGKRGIKETMKELHLLGPSTIVITDGKNGAHASNGHEVWHCKPIPVPVIESTGAGDAFATGFVAGTIKAKPLPECMKMGMANSASVIQHVGAKNILMSSSGIQKAISRIPSYFLHQLK